MNFIELGHICAKMAVSASRRVSKWREGRSRFSNRHLLLPPRFLAHRDEDPDELDDLENDPDAGLTREELLAKYANRTDDEDKEEAKEEKAGAPEGTTLLTCTFRSFQL